MHKYYKQVAEKHGVSTTLVEFAVKHFCKETKDYLVACDNKGVLINGFGTILPYKHTMPKKIEKYQKLLQQDLDDKKRIRLEQRLEKIKNLYSKVQNEKYKYY